MVKRNDVVYNKQDDATSFTFYGRVNRILPNGLVETIDCGKYVRVQPSDELVVINYKGKWEEYFSPSKKCYIKRWNQMPTLRQLKQMAARYDKTVWKKNRNNG